MLATVDSQQVDEQFNVVRDLKHIEYPTTTRNVRQPMRAQAEPAAALC